MHSKNNSFITSKCVITQKIQGLSKKISYRCRLNHSNSLCYISWKSNKKYNGKRKPHIYKHNFIQVLSFIFRFRSTLLLIIRIKWIIKEQIKDGQHLEENRNLGSTLNPSGNSKSTLVVERGRGVLEKETKTNSGVGGGRWGVSSLSVRPLCQKKNSWFFKQQTELFLINYLAVARSFPVLSQQ